MSAEDRILEAFRDLVRAELERLTFYGCWEYAVESTDEDGGDVLVTGHPTTTEFPLPAMVKWPIRIGVAGMKAKPDAGDRVIVMFANADPARPVVVAFESHEPQFKVARAVIDSAGPYAIVGGSLKVSTE